MQSVKLSLYGEWPSTLSVIFLNQKQELEYHFAHELKTVSVDVSENVELKDAFYLQFPEASDPN